MSQKSHIPIQYQIFETLASVQFIISNPSIETVPPFYFGVFGFRLYTVISKFCLFRIPVDFEFARTFRRLSIFYMLILSRDFEWGILFILGLIFQRLVVPNFMKDIYVTLNYYKRNKIWCASRPKFCFFCSTLNFYRYLL